MQLKLFSFVTLAFATLAAATPTPNSANTDECTTGELQCCDSISSLADNAELAVLLSLVGAVVQNVNLPIGISCSAITGAGASASTCTSQPVCCTNNSFNGVVALGCTPANIVA